LDNIRLGDQRAFEALVTQFQSRVFSYALRLLGDREEAEDLAQEVFVTLHQSLDTFKGQSQLSTWIYRITRNRCLNRLKYLERRAWRQSSELDAVPPARLLEGNANAPASPDKVLEGQQLQLILERALEELPEETRTMVLLRDLEGLAYEAIAEICDRPVGTIKSRLHRARITLAVAVAQAEQELTAPPSPGATRPPGGN